MKNINFIRIILTIKETNKHIVLHNQELVFSGVAFKNCDTIEEIRDKFKNEILIENINYIEIWTYPNKKELDKNKFYEYIGE